MERSLILTSTTMSKPTALMPDEAISHATLDEIDSLVALYAKQFQATGRSNLAEPECHEWLVELITRLCKEGKLWVIRDSHGPITLGHYEPHQEEVVTVVTRDGMEENGWGTRMLHFFAEEYPEARIKPVTNSGKRLATKCGFSPQEDDRSIWRRSTKDVAR
jgi:hypothetical protein